VQALTADLRHAWTMRKVVKAWASVLNKITVKVLRGRPMSEPERIGVEGLDPLEQSYRTFYQLQVSGHKLDQVRKAISKVVPENKSVLRVNSANYNRPIHDYCGDRHFDHKNSGGGVSDRNVARHFEKGEALNALQDWVRAVTPPSLAASFQQTRTREDSKNSNIAEEQEGEGGRDKLLLFEQLEFERNSKEMQRNKDITAKNSERKRLDELIVTIQGNNMLTYSIPPSLPPFLSSSFVCFPLSYVCPPLPLMYVFEKD